MEAKKQDKLEELEVKIDAILKSTRKTETYFKWTFWITIIVFVLPLLGMIFIIPTLISTYTEMMNGLV